MSKKRLYEIAKELGKESKEVVARAKELGLDVKSHSSSVEEAAASKIVASFKTAPAPKVESKPVAPKPVVTKEEAKPAATVAPKEEKVAPAKPQSRNFKAEREARAKEQAERRKQNKGNNRDHQQNGNRQKNDNRNGGKQGQGNRDNRRFNDQGKKQQGQQNRGNDRRQQEDKRPNQAGPRIDFKARAAALKAEQNAEYARSSEERFKQSQAAKEALAQANKRKEPEEIFEEAAKLAEQAQPVQQVVEAAPAAKEPVVDTRRKKQARPDKDRDDYDHEEDGPRKQQKNRSSQNQVRNQRNSNWNNNKKNKKGNNKNNRNQAPKPVTERKFHELPTEFEYTDGMTVAEIAKRIKREPAEIVKKLFMMGVMATQNQSLDGETIELLMVDYGIEAKQKVEVDNADIERFFAEEGYLNEDELVERPPVVTIMGHVDHGKTTLLDQLRNSSVVAGEAGGITQHIGAYQVRYNDNKITFLDTPGHEAFTAMRLRGAKSTDIAVLVVAADDGVMPQTIEAINHAKSADVPIIVAINKMDKPGANPDHVKQQLSEHGLLPEEWGGDVIMVPVSAKQKQGIDDLLENILLVAEVMELKANPNRKAYGVVIEAQLDKGRGAVCTVLVQKGSLRVGDTVLAGTAYGKVRAMTNERGEKVKVARPSMPVEILGFSEVPQAGEIINGMDDNEARAIAEKRIAKQRVQELQATHKVTLDDIFNQIQQGELKDLNIIIKADVQGSVEALRQSLEGIKNPEVRIVIVHAAVGAINESDIMLASASNAIVMGFNVRPDANVRRAAENEKVDLRTYRVIYDAINDVESAMRGMLAPQFKEVVVGRAEVRQVISTPKAIVAGSYVTEGRITNDSEVRLIRDGIVVFEGKVDSLRRFKDEVKEVKTSFECGISLEGYRDIKEGDVIEAYLMEEVAPQI